MMSAAAAVAAPAITAGIRNDGFDLSVFSSAVSVASRPAVSGASVTGPASVVSSGGVCSLPFVSMS